ncbi:hypothetical protein GS429_07775 [Natronorubrum sp. JWXQ-INN-674]|uniref:Uncharacterized protein n=1 Tax=Natronorubrum halalkaliphilum TaxID=2691917 RepID=A0A6B0VLR9_9EURY|nr:hypothetical protein [Natronorubrum halalkaliphilum]MXV61956.1 hypothetical protein [Natronorubrum halalkaliphilum]
MVDSDENHRTIAACEQCGSLYAALKIGDDQFRPIGRRDGCECGSMAFTPVDDGVSDVSLEDDTDEE